MTAFKLKKKESAKKGIRRVAHDRAEDAVGLLRDEEADPIEAVHEARKDLKKLRATLKLVRPLIGEKAYGRENARFRDAGRALPGGWWTLRALLVDELSGNGALESLREQVSDEIERGDQAIEDWPLGANGFDLLGPGLKRAYSRGRRRFRDARKDPSDERLHEWRKRSKDLWYQLRLVRRAWPEVMTTTADEAHELSDRLGDDHDLVVLTADLEDARPPLSHEQLEHLRKLIGKRRKELQGEAFAYGERLFAEKPKRFVERIERYWDAAKL